jgi:hypothetical protein
MGGGPRARPDQYRAPREPRGGQAEQPKDKLTQQGFSLLASGQEEWYEQRRQAGDNFDFAKAIDRLNHRIARLGGTPVPTKPATPNAPAAVDTTKTAEQLFMEEKEKASQIADSGRLEQMSADLRQCQQVLTHFEADLKMEREKLKTEMLPLFERVYTTPRVAQSVFEEVAASRDPKRAMLEALKKTDANMAVAESLDYDSMLAEANGESRLFAQIAFKRYPDLFGDMRGQVNPRGWFTKGGPDAQREAAFKEVEDYDPTQYAEAELRLAQKEILVLQMQQKFQSIDMNYRKVLEIELMKKLDQYNDLMAQRVGNTESLEAGGHPVTAPQPQTDPATLDPNLVAAGEAILAARQQQAEPPAPAQDPAPEVAAQPSAPVAETAPEQASEQAPAPQQAAEQAQEVAPTPAAAPENPLGLKEAKRPRFMTEKQIAAMQKRFAKHFPEAAPPEQATDYVPMHTLQKQEREAAKAAKEAARPPVAEAPQPDAQAQAPEHPQVAEQPQAPEQPQVPELRADRDPPPAGDLPPMRVTREEAEAAGKGHLHKGGGDDSLARSFTYDELRAGLKDLDERIEAARAKLARNPARGTDKWWDQSR